MLTKLAPVLLLAIASPAAADPSMVAATPILPADPTVHHHDGFYLRIGTGFGGYGESITAENADQSTTVSGMATVGEFALGGAIRPGFVIGGGFWTSTVAASERVTNGPMPPPEVLGGSGNYTLFGPFFDYWLKPTGGLHVQAAIGLATVRGWDLPNVQDNPGWVSFGGGAMVGLGYDWWVSEQWSFGVLGRITGIVAAQDDATDMRWTHTLGTSPSVLFTATYN